MNTTDIDRATIADKRATADSLIIQAMRLRREADQIEQHINGSTRPAQYSVVFDIDGHISGYAMIATGSITALNEPIRELRRG